MIHKKLRGGPDEERTPAARLESLARELSAGDRGLWARAAALHLAAAARTLRDGAWVANEAGLTLQARELGEWSQVLTRPQPQPQVGQRQLLFGAAPRS